MLAIVVFCLIGALTTLFLLQPRWAPSIAD
jgi:hypothetical protein